jgi:hypothetical protein
MEQNRLDGLVAEHAKTIAVQAQVLIEGAFAPVTSKALGVAKQAAATVDAELVELEKRRANRAVGSDDYKRSRDYLTTEKRPQAVAAAINAELAPNVEAGKQQLMTKGGPAPIAPGDLLSAAPLAQMLSILTPTERPALVESVLLNYAVEKRSPAALLPLLRSSLEAKDFRQTNGMPGGQAWSRLFDLHKHAETLARTPEQVAAIATPNVVNALNGSLKMLSEGFATEGGLEQSPQWFTGALATLGGPKAPREAA